MCANTHRVHPAPENNSPVALTDVLTDIDDGEVGSDQPDCRSYSVYLCAAANNMIGHNNCVRVGPEITRAKKRCGSGRLLETSTRQKNAVRLRITDETHGKARRVNNKGESV